MESNSMNLSENSGKNVLWNGCEMIRDADACSPEIFRFLRYLAEKNLPVETPLFFADGKEHYRFVQAETVHPGPWTNESLFVIGGLVRALHDAGRSYIPEAPLRYRSWYLREIGDTGRIWCHGDIAPWNMLTLNGMPYVLIDWEYAGPLDPMVEFARVCWLFCQLYDDDIAEMHGLPSPELRAAQVRILCDGYGLCGKERANILDRIIDVIVCETAHEAIDPKLTVQSVGELWGFAWRCRSLYWIFRHRRMLEAALI